jgi:hypothetical protein
MAMTNFIIAPKSGSQWTDVELEAFNIQIENQTSADFFGVDPLPAANVPDAILNTISTEAAQDVNMETYKFLCLMEDAMLHTASEFDVDNFALRLLFLMGYESIRDCIVKLNVDLTFKMCQSKCQAQMDICVTDRSCVLLVVQQDKNAVNDPEIELPVAQLVAKCIAAFDKNNLRRDDAGKKRLSEYLMPGIVLRGTTPYFYKMKVTQDLVDGVEKGERPKGEPTKIFQHKPRFPSLIERGMVPLGNRRVALECYEAFKVFVFQSPP